MKALSRRITTTLIVMAVLVLPASLHADALEDAELAYITGRYAEAGGLLQPLAERGQAGAQFLLGAMHYLGMGTAPDRALARDWLRKAAAQGYADARYNLRMLYDFREGVPDENPLAIYSYKKAAQNGDAEAQFIFAKIYDLGKGLIENDSLAMIWYLEAADQGQPDAMAHLGIMFAFGDGVGRDVKEGVNRLYQAGRRFADDGSIIKALATLAVIRGLAPRSIQVTLLEGRIEKLTAQAGRDS
ncbi:MAG: sel1 repeat family protein [SAR324 cluster bacterium]|nr:sel1 repeat family protein [SAR324 cluster bacterium]